MRWSEKPECMTDAPFYYWYFFGHGRELLEEELRDPHPFSLPGAAIVERVLAAGYTPQSENIERKPFKIVDQTSLVRRGDQTFLVWVNQGSETIAVQEQRADAYGPE